MFLTFLSYVLSGTCHARTTFKNKLHLNFPNLNETKVQNLTEPKQGLATGLRLKKLHVQEICLKLFLIDIRD